MDLEGEDRLIAAAPVTEREEDGDLQEPAASPPVAPPVDESGDEPPDTIH